VLPDPPTAWSNEYAALVTEAQLNARSLADALETFQSLWVEVPIG
jgi:hypothetical protein